ncbi:MAG TPA: hypothetical protein VK694_00230 [Verrucomicrobiae bacterium]|nr:hypothetical protein [Verrucomicrobiae bacterium]
MRRFRITRRHAPVATLAAIGLIAVASGCSTSDNNDATNRENNTQRISLDNDLEGGGATFEHDLGSGITLMTSFSAPGYDVDDWRITDSKSIHIQAQVASNSDGVMPEAEVLIESMHADVFIDARKNLMDGIKQDTMDDSLHGGTQPGFAVGGPSEYEYTEVFSIEGHSDTFMTGYGYYMEGYGRSELSEKRPTENNLRKDAKVTGNKFQIVWNVLVRLPGETTYHKVAFVDEFIVEIVPAEDND